MEKIIINTDIGGDFDDLLALILAINSPEIELKGVVTTKEDIREKAKFARKVLNLAGKKNVPIFYNGQLKNKKGKYISVHDYSFLTKEDLDADDLSFGISNRGIEFIIETIERNPKEITLISLAPNTNFAVAMQQNPAIIPKIKSLYLMGGTFYKTPENIDYPEHNYMRDRRSFNYITSQCIPIYLTPRDITRDLFLDPSILQAYAKQSEFQRTVNELAQRFLEIMNRQSLRLSDVIAMGSLVFPELYKVQPVKLVTEKGKQGYAVYCQSVEESNVQAFYDFNRKELYKRLTQRL